MPYAIRQNGSKFYVVQSDSGKVVGTHPSKKKAQAQVAALYANVEDTKMEKMILTGGEGFSIEYNTPDCQGGYCITKNGTGQSIGCWPTEAEAKEALSGMVGEATDLVGNNPRTAKTPEEIQSDQKSVRKSNDGSSFWGGAFAPVTHGQMGPEFATRDQDSVYYFPSQSPRDTDGENKVGYGVAR